MRPLRLRGGVDGAPGPLTSARARPPSPVELLHPDGTAGRAVVLGGGLPAVLRRGLPEDGDGDAGVVVLAPAEEEARDRGWLREAVGSAAGALAPDGLVYVLARRRSAARLLEGEGLEVAAALVHLPRRESPRLVASAEPRALRHALSTLLPPTPRRRLAAAAAPLLRESAVVARRPGSRPLLAWLRELAPDADTGCVILTPTWRDMGGSTLVHVFARDGRAPAAVGKVGTGGAEHEALASVAVPARVAGIDTPAPLAAGRVGAAQVVLASAVEGRPAAWGLAGRPSSVVDLLDRVAAWLEQWNRATRAQSPFTAAEVEERLLEDARELAPHLPDAPAYEAWLRDLCGSLLPIPAVAAHNDLTTANVLVAGDGGLAVVDWEAARPRDLPLRDLVYTVVDAYLADGGYVTRAEAFDACFAGRGEPAATAERLVAGHRASLDLGAREAVACFHACWLEHALNEARRGGAGGEFVRISARLARDRNVLAERIGRL